MTCHRPRDATKTGTTSWTTTPMAAVPGMVMKPEPIFAAVEAVFQDGPIILMSPAGTSIYPGVARELAAEPRLYPSLRPLRGC